MKFLKQTAQFLLETGHLKFRPGQQSFVFKAKIPIAPECDAFHLMSLNTLISISALIYQELNGFTSNFQNNQ